MYSADEMKKKPTIMPAESQTVEWKQSLGEWKEIVETCAAFASSEGGIIYVGVKPDGQPEGISVGKGSLEDIINKIKLNTDPPLFPSVVARGEDQSSVIEIKVGQSTVQPVCAFGKPVKRVGRTNQMLKREEAQRLLEASTGKTWDTFRCEDFTSEDISKKAVRAFLKLCGLKPSTPVDDVMHNMKMTAGNGYSNAVALLFGKNPQRFIIQAQTKCARFEGNDSVRFLDERTFEGTVFEQLNEAMLFVARNTRRAIVITGKPAHDVVPEYPEEAVREAIINALCHRDYADTGTIQVRIYDDCLEVWNPGSLPPDLTVKKLYHRHRSYPRNVKIAGAFFRTNSIEQWGSGTLRIIEACRKHKIRVQFENDGNTFIVRFTKEVRSQLESRLESQLESLSLTVLNQLTMGNKGKSELARALKQKQVSGQLHVVIRQLLSQKLVERTIPEKPNSRLQKYRLTAKGLTELKKLK